MILPRLSGIQVAEDQQQCSFKCLILHDHFAIDYKLFKIIACKLLYDIVSRGVYYFRLVSMHYNSL